MLKFDQCELLAVVDVARDLHVDFVKLAPLRDFETSSRGQKTIGSHLKKNFYFDDVTKISGCVPVSEFFFKLAHG